MVILHIKTKRTVIDVSNQTLKITSNQESHEHPLAYIKAIFVYVDILLNSNVVKKCHELNIDLIFCREKGHSYASLGHPRIGSRANLVSKQLRVSTLPLAQQLANDWVALKVKRRLDLFPTAHSSTKYTNALSNYKLSIKNTTDFLKNEAALSKQFYKLYNLLLPEEMKFRKRSRQPAQDFTNALLNYGYGLLYPTVEKAIIQVGLDPYIGFHHGMARKDKAFLFDVIEMYRPWVEQLIWNHSDELKGFSDSNNYLSEACRRVLIDHFYTMLYQENTPKTNIKTIKKELKAIAISIQKA